MAPILSAMQSQADAAGDNDRLISVDSATAQAHRHTTGARRPQRKKGGTGRRAGRPMLSDVPSAGWRPRRAPPANGQGYSSKRYY